jgi:acyl transferase domain-containing protein/thioesterase domain-containing protein/acyl carrier protein
MAMTEQGDMSATDIAIIGMALRVPGANTVEQFWRNLRSGVESIRSLTHEELLAAGESADKLRDRNYVARTADLGGMELFDADFFGFGRQEAAIMDPQHRQFLECAWEAIENSARPPKSLNGPVGVFAGCGMGSYFYFNICSHQKLLDQVGMFLLRHTGNDKDFLATRVSHLFDLHGPSVNVQTACSTSLVAVHYACQSLLNGECDMALAGGVTIELPHRRGYMYQDGEILSPDGHCRAFDHRAAGTVFGSGAGVVVLRRLADAIAGRDPIRAVIKATAINNDGASKAGYLAPSVTGQAEAIVEAQTLAGVTADTLQYVECHGTGTNLGDPIEVEALSHAFRHSTDRKGFCLIGSVKSNVGHLDTAAGVVSLIKTTLALEHAEIPPTLGYEKPNPAINFAASPFRVCDRLTPWPATGGPRRAGVNSLGVGGTNAHAVLEQAPARQPATAHSDGEAPQLLVLSAKSRKALDDGSRRLADFLDSKADVALPDIGSTLFHGRTQFAHRRVVAALDRAQAISILRATDRNAAAAHALVENVSGAVFLFPGGGAQYPGMARSLYRQELALRATVDEGLSFLPADVAKEVRALWLEDATPDAAQRFYNPALQLPAILITEIAIAQLWMSWGIKPDALIGHSMGEYAAACLAGVLSFKSAVELVHLRGRLFTEIPPGGMLSVPLAEEALLARLPPDLDVASVNAPELCVVSGDNEGLDRFQATLAADDIECVRVAIDIAAHSRMLEPILGRFEAYLKGASLSKPSIPIISNLTGTWLTDVQARDPGYWRAHLRSKVRFAEGMKVLSEDPTRIYIEVGAGRTMTSLVKAQSSISANQVINSLPHADEAGDDRLHFMGALGRAWATGLPVPLERLWTGVETRRVPLPSYPFQHEVYWIAPNATPRSAGAGTLKHETIEDWFAAPTWVRSPLLSLPSPSADSKAAGQRCWLIYSDRSAVAAKIAKRLGGTVVIATNGTRIKKNDEHHWSLDFTSWTQHQELLNELEETGFKPTDVIYFCGLAALHTTLGIGARRGDLQQQLSTNFFVPTFILRAIGSSGDPVNFSVVTRGLAQVHDEPVDPMRAPLIGPVLVAPRETPQIKTRCIDVERVELGHSARQVEQALVDELLRPPADRLVALRGASRWLKSQHKLKMPAAQHAEPWLRDGGVYVITGGLGGIALEIAEHFARLKKVKLALLARSELPPEVEWDDVLRVLPAESLGAQRMRRIRAIRALGADAAVFTCDIADGARVKQALEEVRAKLGPIAGIIHAAGVMDDEPIGSKSLSSMQRVLYPKVAGAIHLDRLIHGPLDFFILFSSVASTLGLPGQVDYTAANAFLDAFAIDRASRAPGRTVVINWNAWRDIGMAARASDEQQHGRTPSSVVAHPALDGYSDDHGTGRTFVTDFAIDRHWLLSEHKIKNGMALLSGTTFVELARAAFSVGKAPGPIEIQDLTFLTPFQVAEGTPRRLVIQIATEGGASEITMRTAGDDARSLPHVIGDISAYDGGAPAPVDLDAIIARCPTHLSVLRGGAGDQYFVDFGPRWENIRSIRYGQREALLDLSLDPKFAPDLEHYQLHPAMLDTATAGAQRLIPGFDSHGDFYVPVVYGRLRLFDRMPHRFFSHVRLRPESGHGEAFFDITLIDVNGRPFCEISRFQMKRIDAKSALVGTTATVSSASTVDTALQKVLRDAIMPAEGLEAFDRIMGQPHLVQCIASSMDIEAWDRSLAVDGAEASESEAEDGSAGSFSRPDLESAYEAPETESEKFLARVWSELLGVRQIGVNDDFFQLGGHSLHAVRLFVAVRKQYGLSLPLSTLFERPSIRPLAALLDAQSPQKQSVSGAQDPKPGAPAVISQTEYSSLVPIQPIGTGPAFYCGAGMGGNPLNLRALALEMGIDQPFYGLQPQGLDGQSKLHQSIPEMASHYIAEIRRKQPNGPYYLGGYSGGGVVAFEMAKQLVAAGERIGALVFLDSIAPGAELPSLLNRADTLVAGLREEGLPYALNFVKWAIDRRINRVTAVTRKPLRRLFPYHYRIENIADTWNEAFAAYQPTPYTGDAMLFRASTGFVLGSDVGRLNGWEGLILGNIEVNQCPGHHSSMCEQPHVRVLARRLRSYLQRQVRDNTVRDANLTTLDTHRPSPSLAQSDAGLRVTQKSTGEAVAS